MKKKGYLDHIPDHTAQAVKGVQISAFKKNKPDQLALHAILINLVTDTANYFGGMDDSRIQMVIDNIKIKFWFFKVEEIAMVFNRAVMGMIPVYGKITPVAMLGWLHDYDTGERLKFCESEAGKHKEPYEKQFEEMSERDRQENFASFKENLAREKSRLEARKIAQGEQEQKQADQQLKEK